MSFWLPQLGLREGSTETVRNSNAVGSFSRETDANTLAIKMLSRISSVGDL